MKKVVFTLVTVLLSYFHVFCQTFPFPQNITYPHGFKTTKVTSALAQNEYNRWKQNFVVTCGDYKRTTTETATNTKVESMGWALILAAYQGDKPVFDALWGFYNSKRTAKANGFMGWHVTCNGYIDEGSAVDGDLDVAFGLILAQKQWGGVYLDSAKNILTNIRTNLLEQCTVNGESVYVIKGGYANGPWGGCDLTDISYYTPAFFRVFAEVTGDNAWAELADDTYIILNAGAHPTTGLVPDWQTAAGEAGPGTWNGTYAYDASRVPWRIALDYLWNGNTKAKEWCTKVTNWANNIGPANIKDGYNLDGTTDKTYNNSAFVGGFAVGAMCNSQAIADNFGTRMAQLNESYWYNLNLRVVYLHVMTGNFWNPSSITAVNDKLIDEDIKVIFNSHTNLLSISGLPNSRGFDIINLEGKVITSVKAEIQNNFSVNVPSLKKGIYILRVSTDDGKQINVKFYN